MDRTFVPREISLDQVKKTSFLLVVICGYIFLLIDRPWESISYLRGFRLQAVYAVFMIFVALMSGRFVVRKARTNVWVYGLLALHFVLAPFAFSPSAAVDQGIEYAKAVLVYFLMIAAVDDEADLKIILHAFALSMVVYTLHSLWEFQNGRHVYRMDMIRMVGVGEAYSDPNAFGASLVLSVPIVFVLARFDAKKWLSCLYYAYVGFLVPACVVLTGSRSAFIALLFCWILGIIKLNGVKKILILVLAVIVVLGGWHLMPDDKQERIRTLWDKEAGPKSAHVSADGRWEGFLISMKMFSQHPVTGVGAGGDNYIGYRISIGETPFQAHNLYGEVLSEFGISGAFIFIGLIWSMYRGHCLVREYYGAINNRHSMLCSLSSAIFVSILLLLLMGYGAHNFYRIHWLFFSSWLSICCIIAKKNSKK